MFYCVVKAWWLLGIDNPLCHPSWGQTLLSQGDVSVAGLAAGTPIPRQPHPPPPRVGLLLKIEGAEKNIPAFSLSEGCCWVFPDYRVLRSMHVLRGAVLHGGGFPLG